MIRTFDDAELNANILTFLMEIARELPDETALNCLNLLGDGFHAELKLSVARSVGFDDSLIEMAESESVQIAEAAQLVISRMIPDVCVSDEMAIGAVEC
jgi:hypothetical protein